MATARDWVSEAVRRVQADAQRSADTHLRVLDLPAEWGIDLYLKDESVHPTGSLKHRLARSLFLYGLANGDIGPGTTLVEASSGSTAVSEAYFARLLGLPFVAVVPTDTSPAKLQLIEHHGGRCHLVADAPSVYAEAERLGAQPGWHYLDQFANASTATDWRGNNNIACSIFEQLELERHPVPEWIVVAAGTGGTSATIGRYCRYLGVPTQLALADPEGSVFAEAWRTGRRDLTSDGARIEGIGRGRVEPSFVPGVIDDVLTVADTESIAAMRLLADRTGMRAGPSTGTNLVATFRVVARMLREGRRGSVVTLICDGGDRYLDTYYSPTWLVAQGMADDGARAALDAFLTTGELD
ncbi:PLP-dependent cysteine synthase family protein [Georgenia sp. MJ170]